jgi:hypothetical protein
MMFDRQMNEMKSFDFDDNYGYLDSWIKIWFNAGCTDSRQDICRQGWLCCEVQEPEKKHADLP